jgi:phage head maturation protease
VKSSYLLEPAEATHSPRMLYRAVSADSYSLRANGSSTGDGRILAGRFAVYDRWTEINSVAEGHFMERIAPGSFTKTIRERGNRIPIMFSHGTDAVVGTQILGRVRDLREDGEGVQYEVELFDGIPTLLERGLEAGAYGSSFRAKLVKQHLVRRPGRSTHNPLGLPESTVQELALREFGPCPNPAYQDASAEIRSVADEFMPVRVVADVPRICATSEPVEKPYWLLEREPSWLLEPKGAA